MDVVILALHIGEEVLRVLSLLVDATYRSHSGFHCVCGPAFEAADVSTPFGLIQVSFGKYNGRQEIAPLGYLALRLQVLHEQHDVGFDALIPEADRDLDMESFSAQWLMPHLRTIALQLAITTGPVQ